MHIYTAILFDKSAKSIIRREKSFQQMAQSCPSIWMGNLNLASHYREKLIWHGSRDLNTKQHTINIVKGNYGISLSLGSR